MINWTSTNAHTAGSAKKLTNDKGYTFKVSWYNGGYEILIIRPDGNPEGHYTGLASWDLARILNDWKVESASGELESGKRIGRIGTPKESGKRGNRNEYRKEKLASISKRHQYGLSPSRE